MTYYLESLQKKLAKEIAQILGVKTGEIVVEVANEKIGSHLAVPVFKYAGEQKMAPLDLAKKVIEQLDFEPAEKLEAVSGYVNVWLKPKSMMQGYFDDVKKQHSKQRRYGDTLSHAGESVVVEFTDANPFKEFHIGHLYSNTVGEAISRLYEAGGAHVHRISYHGDVGMHVAKAIWGLQRELKAKGKTMSDISLADRPKFLGASYARGSKAFEDSEQSKAEINELNQAIYDLKDLKIKKIYEMGRAWSFEYFDLMYKRLGMRFERQYLESQTVQIAKKIVKEGLEKKVFEESDGAVVFRGEDYGLHTRVFVNSKGLPTYEAKDLGLAELKNHDFEYDQSIVLTGNEQSTYFEVMLKAMELLRPKLAEKTTHMSHGMVRMTDGKMSSRSGKIMTAQSLLDAIEDEITEKAPDSPSLIANTLGAIKYALLKPSVGGDIMFDLEESISLEGNSGPYIQYAAVRISSLLAKNKVAGKPAPDFDWAEEADILWHLLQYPIIVEHAIFERAPHLIAQYVFELAKLNNQYYEAVSIKDSEEPAKTARVGLLKSTYEIYKHGLYILGIEIPKKM